MTVQELCWLLTLTLMTATKALWFCFGGACTQHRWVIRMMRAEETIRSTIQASIRWFGWGRYKADHRSLARLVLSPAIFFSLSRKPLWKCLRTHMQSSGFWEALVTP